MLRDSIAVKPTMLHCYLIPTAAPHLHIYKAAIVDLLWKVII